MKAGFGRLRQPFLLRCNATVMLGSASGLSTQNLRFLQPAVVAKFKLQVIMKVLWTCKIVLQEASL